MDKGAKGGAVHHLLEGLNHAQREAVTHVDGPLLVLAGPGSGKTRVITHRIAYLIESVRVPAENILAVTFTNKAADEMARRLVELTPIRGAWTSTFHRFCVRVLRRFGSCLGLPPNFTILDQRDRMALLARIMKELQIDTSHFPPDAVERRISGLKNELISADAFAERAHAVFDRIVADVFLHYDRRRDEQNAVDFDDLLVLVARLLSEHAGVRAELNRRHRFILVDEYQDTNLAQYAIARALSLEAPNLCVTGDPDQSIYSWRGADLRNILSFENDFPGARVIALEENYRSTRHILAVADRLIRNNRQRTHKNLITSNPAGRRVVVDCYQDDAAEANGVAETIRSSVDRGARRYRDFAVFVRTGLLTRAIEAALKARAVPYQVVGGVSFYEHQEIRDLLAYARLILNPRDDSAFERIVNVPARGIGETTLARLRRTARDRGRSLAESCGDVATIPGLGKRQQVALAGFRALLNDLSDIVHQPPHRALEAILDRTGYRRVFEHGDEDDQQRRLGNLADMLAAVGHFECEHPDADLAGFLETASLTTDADERDETGDLVTVMTLHAAKGLEFPIVFLVAFERGILPHERSVQDGNEEEERRLAFVGITRAKEELLISYTMRRTYQGRPMYTGPSVFLTELPAESLERNDVLVPTSRAEHAGSSGGNAWQRPMRHRGRPQDDDGEQECGDAEPSIQIYRGVRRASPAAGRFRQGMLVQHPRYGQGRITRLDGDGDACKVTIEFISFGVKRFALSKAPLEPV
jgi:DNA helicase-2/ATP-dependent DNA helicase PcrA